MLAQAHVREKSENRWAKAHLRGSNTVGYTRAKGWTGQHVPMGVDTPVITIAELAARNRGRRQSLRLDPAAAHEAKYNTTAAGHSIAPVGLRHHMPAGGAPLQPLRRHVPAPRQSLNPSTGSMMPDAIWPSRVCQPTAIGLAKSKLSLGLTSHSR